MTVAAPAEPPELARLRDRRVEAWTTALDVARAAELRSRAVTGDSSARRALTALGAHSATDCGDAAPAGVDELVAEVAATRRRNAIHEWRNAAPRDRRGVVIDPPLTGREVDDRRRRRLAGRPMVD